MNKFKITRELGLLIALAAACIMWFNTCNNSKNIAAEAKRQHLIDEQNQRALSDSLRTVKNKAGEAETVTSSFVAKLKDLEKLNRDLYNETRKELGEVKGLIKGSVTVNTGNVVVSNELLKYPDNAYGLKFEKDVSDSGLTYSIKGISKFKLENNTIFPGTTEIFENKTKLKIVLGFKELDNNYEVFARSASKNVLFDELSGVLLIPKKADQLLTPIKKKKRFGIGPEIGIGISTSLKPSIFIGFGANYNLIELF